MKTVTGSGLRVTGCALTQFKVEREWHIKAEPAAYGVRIKASVRCRAKRERLKASEFLLTPISTIE